MTPPPFTPFTLRLGSRLLEVRRPLVMGIINLTPDSFHAASRRATTAEAVATAERMAAEGADIIDVGACSTRPDSPTACEADELQRLTGAIAAIRRACPRMVLSVDTFRSRVARAAVEEGADIVNDVSAGELDPDMVATVASLRVPYIAMHMRGTPATMRSLTDYPGGVVADVTAALANRIAALEQAGVADIIADPGFGFAKTPEQCFTMLRELPYMAATLRCPLLAAMSRKSMLTRTLGITPAEALEATVAAHTMALMQGAAIIRVHDVAPAAQSVELFVRTFLQ